MKTPSLLRLPALALLLGLPLALTACGDAAEDVEGVTQVTPPAEEAAPSEAHEMADGTMMADERHDGVERETVAARVEDGTQVVEIEAGRMGYQPREVALEAGVPARLVFTRTVDSECSSQVRIPAFDVPATDLPLGEPVAIEFTPTESGDFTFVCGMDMQTGSLMVVG